MGKTVKNVAACITSEQRPLVISRAHVPEAGNQVPSGAIEPGKPREPAGMREAFEQTSLPRPRLRAYSGVIQFDFAVAGRNEDHCEHFLHLDLEGDATERWLYIERHASEGGAGPIELDPLRSDFPHRSTMLKADLRQLLHPVEEPGR